MNLMESFRLAVSGIWSNKLRSSLTMLGIIIGIASVITIMTLGKGGQAMVEGQFGALGKTNFNTYVKWDSTEPSSSDDLTIEDIDMLQKLNPYVSNVGGMIRSGDMVKDKKKDINTDIMAVTPSYLEMNSTIKVQQGRFINEEDNKGERNVVVLDKGLANKLFPSGNAIGQRIRMSDQSYVVIGVVGDTMSFVGGGFEQTLLYMPIRTMASTMEHPYVQRLDLMAKSEEMLQPAMDFTKKYLNRVHKHEDHYEVRSVAEGFAEINNMLSILTMVFAVIAGISLLVGGIGVMNIMLVSVTERTREIGIRKALGAKKRDILIQFLIESVIVCLIGGFIGILLGTGLGAIIMSFASMPSVTSWEGIIIAFSFSSAIGIFFGMYPANKAAKLDPIDALRYE
ncbi:ABC transporter permease [Brevibacillus daliensis]|uniref:ABC transporter permease n=1 Tax=Brevibacillus daliensis TaxID=2892995 RepID=UPI001E2F5757|nr:ABC transporter permease [Brevibacillus daliensis]